MSYHAATRGLGPYGLADHAEATVTCDRCGQALVVLIHFRRGPPSWLIDGRAPPGWALYRSDDPFWRIDLCPRCRPQSRRRGAP